MSSHREIHEARRRLRPDGTAVEEEEWSVPPGWMALPSRRATGEEHYEILTGRVRVLVEGAGRTYRAGESVIVGIGQSHTLEPVDGHGLHVRVQRWSAPQHNHPEPIHSEEAP